MLLPCEPHCTEDRRQVNESGRVALRGAGKALPGLFVEIGKIPCGCGASEARQHQGKAKADDDGRRDANGHDCSFPVKTCQDGLPHYFGRTAGTVRGCCQYIRGQRPASFQGSNEQNAAPERRNASLSKIRKGLARLRRGESQLNQINTFCMRLNCAQSKTCTSNIFFLSK